MKSTEPLPSEAKPNNDESDGRSTDAKPNIKDSSSTLRVHLELQIPLRSSLQNFLPASEAKPNDSSLENDFYWATLIGLLKTGLFKNWPVKNS